MRLREFVRMTVFLGLGVSASAAPPVATRPARPPLRAGMQVERLVLAFYYPWYGRPDGPHSGGRWVHWEGVDEKAKTIASSTHYPSLGPYDSHDPETIARHCKWMKDAGIDGMIVSWWGSGTFEDKCVPVLLDECDEAGLKLSIYYETAPDAVFRVRATTNELARIIRRYGRHSAYLKVQGHPVVFVYGRALGQLGLDRWKKVISGVSRKTDAATLWIADVVSEDAARSFDGLHVYGPMGDYAAALKSGEPAGAWTSRAFRFWVDTARKSGVISTVTVFPGYDDRKVRTPGIVVDRDAARVYESLWQAAIAFAPDWVLITSFNEWHEGSEIEPSLEHGERYLRLTRKWADRFHGLKDGEPAPRDR